ncbi:hypothetical protein [Escherichia phage P817]|nr:hypothetical protein [Escherichia phage P817]
MTITTKNFVTSDNRLLKARVSKNGFEQVKINGKWVNLDIKGRYIKTKTLYVTKVNHKSSVKKDFTEGKRYQVSLHAGLGSNAGYIFDNEGHAWQLYRDEDVGFVSLCGTYRWEAQYK